jgi:hypothetical protein
MRYYVGEDFNKKYPNERFYCLAKEDQYEEGPYEEDLEIDDEFIDERDDVLGGIEFSFGTEIFYHIRDGQYYLHEVVVKPNALVYNAIQGTFVASRMILGPRMSVLNSDLWGLYKQKDLLEIMRNDHILREDDCVYNYLPCNRVNKELLIAAAKTNKYAIKLKGDIYLSEDDYCTIIKDNPYVVTYMSPNDITPTIARFAVSRRGSLLDIFSEEFQEAHNLQSVIVQKKAPLMYKKWDWSSNSLCSNGMDMIDAM